ncbi:hypothetical protein ANCCEY_10860 [Ancylostoma ceylanicum]|uniref:Uncharacterized protein n=1 Tax=Ancylostoma ceylanicum TaxID=53326 RepID=A0A0D6LDN4_9BILA|nr:hypothetical protein ANCCEY_10860 [Ancylostoma ceylanicum]
MPCSLFVPTVRGSRQCAICQCSLEAHNPEAIYVEPSRIFTAPNTPRTERKQPRKRKYSHAEPPVWAGEGFGVVLWKFLGKQRSYYIMLPVTL